MSRPRFLAIIAVIAAAASMAAAPDTAPPAGPAETAPQDAPPVAGADAVGASPAPRTSDPLQERVAAEEARLRGVLEGIRARREAIPAATAEERAAHATGTEEIVALGERVVTAADGSPEADALYETLVARLRTIRALLGEALDRWHDPVEVPQARLELDAALLSTRAYVDQAAALEDLQRQIEQEGDRLRAEERDARWLSVELRGERVRHLDAVRIRLLPKLSGAKRGTILSLVSPEGVAQLRREIGQLALAFRYLAARRGRDAALLPSAALDLFRITRMTWSALEIAAILLGLVWVRRRWGAWTDRAGEAIAARLHGVGSIRWVESSFGALRVIGPWTLYLVALALLRGVLGPLAETHLIDVVWVVATTYGVYRLSIDTLVALSIHAASRYRLDLGAARREKLLGSVRSVARLAAGIYVLLALASAVLGKGYLYHLVLRFAWIFALVVAFRLLRRWREEISESYLQVSPSGALADAVRRTRDRWYGLFVAAASFLWLAGSGAAVLARDFALGFDQTRKALAFVFRRRMERQAEQRGYAVSRLEDLPRPLLEEFGEDPLDAGAGAVPHFPGRADLEGLLECWHAGRGGGPFVLTGENGVGKTSWLSRFRSDATRVDRIVLEQRPATADALVEALSAPLFGEGARIRDHRELAGRLLGAEPRIVVVDRGQNLFLMRIGGYEAFEAFTDLMAATSSRVFWICAFNAFAWRHLEAVRRDLSVFRRRQELAPWSEPLIRDLIQRRLTASGIEATFEDLIVDRLEGVSTHATLLSTAEGFTRLLWDYADGIPRIALHYWIRSLVPESPRRVRVRLFRAPDPTELERTGETGLSLLAAVASHENLTLAESATTTRVPERICRIHLDRLGELGALSHAGGRYRITAHWQRAAIRLLRRRNLLPD